MINEKEYEQDLAAARKQLETREKDYRYALVDGKGNVIEKFVFQDTARTWLCSLRTKEPGLKIIKLNIKKVNIKL
jgi:hypothetical protein